MQTATTYSCLCTCACPESGAWVQTHAGALKVCGSWIVASPGDAASLGAAHLNEAPEPCT
eukprot:363797-Chlamydomonas_euryale.AAC.5